MIVVTGGAGFIGSNLVKGFNDQGRTDILVVDELSQANKIKNLADCRFADYMDKDEFLKAVQTDSFDVPLEAIFHEGACSDTMATDGRYVMQNNFTYSKALYQFCQRNKVAFIYASSASVYGAGEVFEETPEFECPLNVYAFSKLAFDNYVRANPPKGFQAVGLRYFNVYGDREQHKDGRGASVAFHFFNQYKDQGHIKLFTGSGGYADGEQRRDFVSVEDVVKVNQFLLENPKVNGFYNVGTGRSRSFNDMAMATLNALHKLEGKQGVLSLEQAISDNMLRYISMPEALHGKYQSYTQADISALQKIGYEQPFYDVEEGVARYIERLWQQTEREEVI